MSAREDFHQLRLKFTDPIQQSYEIIRPIMLFDESVAEWSRQLDIDRTVIGEKARRFIEQGMLGLIDQRTQHSGRKGHVFPEPVAGYLLYLKQLYPPIHDREIVRIIKRRLGHPSSYALVHFECRPAESLSFPSTASWPEELTHDWVSEFEAFICEGIVDGLVCVSVTPFMGCSLKLVSIKYDEVSSSGAAFYEATKGAMAELIK
jgi:hypothetical protein